MITPNNKIVLLVILVYISVCEEWYMPNSNLISDKEFSQRIKEDLKTFKFVKYFTPHCPYCRYLKAAFDTLKVKKEWCFKIYDFNCQWYPQFCRQNVKSTSFPYTVIYNDKGEVHEEIHGFYPEPIIAQIFERIDQACINAQETAKPIKTKEDTTNIPQKVPQEPKPVQQSSLSAQPSTPVEVKPSVPVVMNPETHEIVQKHVQNIHQMAKNIINQKLSNKNQESDNQESKVQQPSPEDTARLQNMNAKASQMPKYLSYFFYAAIIIVAAYYVYQLHSKKPQNKEKVVESPQSDGEHSPDNSNKKISKKAMTVDKQIQQSQLLADEQL